MRSEPLLEVRSLRKAFNQVPAVDGLSFDLLPGEVLGLTGPNGSGKTTVFNLIAGLVRPDGGSVQLQGRELVGLKPHQITRRGLTRTFQLARPFLELTVWENVLVATLFAAGARPAVRGARVQELLTLTDLLVQREAPAAKLSSGCLRRLEVARALATSPQVLLLDEPFSGLSLKEESKMLDLLHNLNQAGMSMILVSHGERHLKTLCQRAIALRAGRKVAEGPADEVLQALRPLS